MGCCSDKMAVSPAEDEDLAPDINKETVKFEPGKLGIRYENNVIDRITEGGQAEKLGVKPGYIIASVNGEEMSDDKAKIKAAISGCKEEGIPVEIEFIIPADVDSYVPVQPKKKPKKKSKTEETEPEVPEEVELTPLQKTYFAFASYGPKSGDGSTMSMANFQKFCVDSNLIDEKNFSKVQVAITFKGVCAKSQKCTFEQFEELLEKVAAKKYPEETPEQALLNVQEQAIGTTPSQSEVTQPQEYNFSTPKRRNSRTKNKNKQPAVKMQSNKARPLSSLTSRETKVDVRGVPVNLDDDPDKNY